MLQFYVPNGLNSITEIHMTDLRGSSIIPDELSALCVLVNILIKLAKRLTKYIIHIIYIFAWQRIWYNRHIYCLAHENQQLNDLQIIHNN